MMRQCKACGGIYNPVLADGSAYFHACPPLSAAELAAAVLAGQVVLPIDPRTNLPETADVAVTRRTYPRANAVNENLGANSKPIAVGAGSQQIAPPVVTPAPVATPAPVLQPPTGP